MNAKAIRTRMKSVESTMHITHAMQLVASSKMKKAQDQMAASRTFFEALDELFQDMAHRSGSSIFLRERPVHTALYIMIAGDRGLAGGYNHNIFKMVEEAQAREQCEVVFLPIGKRACDYCSKRGYKTIGLSFTSCEKFSKENALQAAYTIKEWFQSERIDLVRLFYTDFINMLSQMATQKVLLPISAKMDGEPSSSLEFEPSPEAVMEAVIPQYLVGLLYGAVRIAFTSEVSARRNAMDSATQNAEEMLDHLSLTYNQARQAAITQEITEIVGGAAAN